MRSPVFSVLGAFLFVAVFGPFVLLFAGPALTGDPDAARVGLYLLLNVNPVAIPVLLVLLGITWVVGLRTTPSLPSRPDAVAVPRPLVVAPRPTAHVCRPDIVLSTRRATDCHDVVIDVVAMQADARPILHGAHRLPLPILSRPALPFQASPNRRPR
jgi:hypothetical protein